MKNKHECFNCNKELKFLPFSFNSKMGRFEESVGWKLEKGNPFPICVDCVSKGVKTDEDKIIVGSKYGKN